METLISTQDVGENMPKRNWFSSAKRDSYGLNFFGWTKKGKPSKKMTAKVYSRKGRAGLGGYRRKEYRNSKGRLVFTENVWEKTRFTVRRRK